MTGLHIARCGGDSCFGMVSLLLERGAKEEVCIGTLFLEIGYYLYLSILICSYSFTYFNIYFYYIVYLFIGLLTLINYFIYIFIY